MTSLIPWHDIMTCVTDSKQLVHRHSARRSATQEAAGRKGRPEGQGQALCNRGLEIREVRTDLHASHARLVQCCRSACSQISRARVSGECGYTTAWRSEEGGGGPRAAVAGETMALYETVLLGAIFQFAIEVMEMSNYQKAFLQSVSRSRVR